MSTSRMTMSTAASSKIRSAVKVRSSKEKRRVPSASSTWHQAVVYVAREIGVKVQSWIMMWMRWGELNMLPLQF